MSTADARTVNDTKIPRILLFSGTAPGEFGVGGIVLRDMCDSLPPGMLRCFVVPTRGNREYADRESMEKLPEVADFVERRYDTAYRPVPGILGELIALAARKAKRPQHLRRIVARAVECGRSYGAEMVWAVLNCPTVIQTATHVAARLGVPLIVLVWDAPELLSHQLQHDRWFARAVVRDFDATMRSAARCAAIGETMKEAYDQAYGKDASFSDMGSSQPPVRFHKQDPATTVSS